MPESIALRLHQLFNSFPRHEFPFVADSLPRNGVYFLFEKGETYFNLDRIVRVGTHTGPNQLVPRLQQHFILENKDRSIFRKNIGRALLKKDESDYLDVWNRDFTTRDAKDRYSDLIDLDYQSEVEKRVSDHIRTNITFCVLRIDSKADRLDWEKKLVSTLAQLTEDRISKDWLGNSSPIEKIRRYGLWQVNGLLGTPLKERDLDEIEEIVVL